jgi:hypothetical protein
MDDRGRKLVSLEAELGENVLIVPEEQGENHGEENQTL